LRGGGKGIRRSYPGLRPEAENLVRTESKKSVEHPSIFPSLEGRGKGRVKKGEDGLGAQEKEA
jgi:hypothetical protein